MSTASLRSSRDLAQYLTDHQLDWAACQLPDPVWLDSVWPIRIPTHYADLIDWRDPHDPLRLMVLPHPAETQSHTYEVADPISDQTHEAVPGLIHRYPDRVLLLLTTHCLVHCRFCFRKEVVGKVRPVEFIRIKEYLISHPEVQEVIFSGGDPFTFPAGFLETVHQQLQAAQQIKIWRFHTRVPVVDPQSVSPDWLNSLTNLTKQAQVVVVTHINHPRELTPTTKHLFHQLQQRGVRLLSQTVLLKGVNDQPEILAELFRQLLAAGVKPYYLHHLDRAYGTHHFRVSISQGKALVRQLRGTLSGLAQPSYVLDLPGGHGKVPVEWLIETTPGVYQVSTFAGQTVVYPDPAVHDTAT